MDLEEACPLTIEFMFLGDGTLDLRRAQVSESIAILVVEDIGALLTRTSRPPT
jgi:hypothetical protein